MLEDVCCSSGVVGRSGCLPPPNCDPNDKEGRRERRGVGSLGLVLLSENELSWENLGSRLKFADMSAVREAIGLRRSHFDRLLMSKYPVPEDDAEVALV